MEMKKILQAFTSGATTPKQIAQSLGVSGDALHSRLDTLLSLGYLEPVGDGCEAEQTPSCSGCNSSPACSSDATAPLSGWRLTEKGKRLLNS